MGYVSELLNKGKCKITDVKKSLRKIPEGNRQ